MMKAQEKISIARCALFGALGFFVGAILGGAIGLIPLEGAFGGAALGLALNRDRRTIAFLALAGLISFTAGWFLGFYIQEWLDELGLAFLGHIIRYGLPGALGGAALGLTLWNKKKIIGSTLAGVIGFGIPMMIIFALPLDGISQLMLGETIGGAFFAAAFGYLERGRRKSS